MKRIQRVITPALLAAIATGAVTLPTIASAAPPPDPQVLLTVAQEFAQHRADALVANREVLPSLSAFADGAIPAGAELRSEEATATAELAARRQRLAEAGEQYSGARTEVVASRLEENERGITLIVEELTTLDYARVTGEEPPYTSFKSTRRFEFAQVDGRWQLTGQHFLDEGGPLPVTEPPSGEEAGAPLDDPEAASVERPAVPHLKKVDSKGYNYQAMSNYARRHVHNYNPSYRRFNDVGGDCTNFISQALRAGGWQNDSGWYRDYHNWWYNSGNQTWSWINVNYWASFALSSRRSFNLTNVWLLSLGDILQMDFTSNQSKDHSMIVTVRSSTMPYLTYHSNDTLNRSLQSLLDSHRQATYYAFRT